MKTLNINKFFTTPFGSFAKVFLIAMIIFIGEKLINYEEIHLNKELIKSVVRAGFIAVIPTLYNIINPKYTLYGRKDADGHKKLIQRKKG